VLASAKNSKAPSARDKRADLKFEKVVNSKINDLAMKVNKAEEELKG
jgi:hypothetical protein